MGRIEDIQLQRSNVIKALNQAICKHSVRLTDPSYNNDNEEIELLEL